MRLRYALCATAPPTTHHTRVVRYVLISAPSRPTHCSCDPNTWFVGDTKMTARRDIEPEEELTYDYATTDTIGTSSSLHSPLTSLGEPC